MTRESHPQPSKGRGLRTRSRARLFGAIHFDVTMEDNEQAAKEKTKVWISRSVEQRLFLGRDSEDGLLGAAAGFPLAGYVYHSCYGNDEETIYCSTGPYGCCWCCTVGTHNKNCYFHQLAVPARMSLCFENGGVLSALQPPTSEQG